jgi:uncharacterized membrane protein (DUF485 family)
MVGLMQIMIYLLCVYLIYKGVEIFQIGLTCNIHQRSRTPAIVIGVLAIMGAIFFAGVALFMTESIVAEIGKNINNSFPNLR